MTISNEVSALIPAAGGSVRYFNASKKNSSLHFAASRRKSRDAHSFDHVTHGPYSRPRRRNDRVPMAPGRSHGPQDKCPEGQRRSSPTPTARRGPPLTAFSHRPP